MNDPQLKSSRLQQFIGWVVTLALPFALVLTGVRLLLTPAYVHVEYRTPNFPEDMYGFTLEDRLKWSILSLDYLLNDEGIDFLADLKFEDGTPIYNERELAHMLDVKIVVQVVLKVWLVAVCLVVLPGFLAWRTGQLALYKKALRRGVFFTAGFVGAVILFMAVSFSVFFVFFHDVFFAPGTWTFYYSDTLIRLFPERFWRDTFLWVGGLAFLQALIIYFWAKPRGSS